MIDSRHSYGTRMKIAVGAMLLAASLVAPATGHADCGDPGQDPCTGPVPTVDQVTAIMDRLTDPNVPAPDKSDIVIPPFTDNEFHKVDCMTQHHLSAPWIITDIQPAPNNFAGATVAVPAGFRTPPPLPFVLVDQGGHWMTTHRSAMAMLDNLYRDAISSRAIQWCWF
jgi:hypothetical protein